MERFQTIKWLDAHLGQERIALSPDPSKPSQLDARTARTQISTRGQTDHPNVAGPWPLWVGELARFYVPRGHIGIVKTFDQFLGYHTLESTEVLTVSDRWGIPFSGFGAIDVVPPLRWHFRLTEFEGTYPQWYDAVGTGNIPGMPYNDFSFTDDLWYPAHSPSANKINLIVPGKYMLRVFIELGAQNVRFSAAAKLTGWSAVIYSEELRRTIRENW